MERIAVLASGNGSNAENLAHYFNASVHAKVALIISNKPSAYVLERAKNLGIPSIVRTGNEMNESEIILNILKEHDISWIVLAGYLLKIPNYLIQRYPNKIINIHPALLPLYGGKGMYGMNVHNAVVEASEEESGISIHFVNEAYDEGKILFQSRVKLASGETPDSLAQKIHELEYKYFPQIVEKVISGEIK